jgi:[ribosomal protein S5]-alanine N-acetyltransferase
MVSTVAPGVSKYDPSIVLQSSTESSQWQQRLPHVQRAAFTLRELRLSDAPSLLAMLSTEEVSRFISPPPTTVEGYERFITWSQQQRAEGKGVCFGIVPAGSDAAVGIIQVRSLDAAFETAEWGFALGSSMWGTGLFMAAATQALAFAFQVLNVRRLEARACVENGRGNGVLRKLGGSCEARLRRSFNKNGQRRDQYLWALSADEWFSSERQRPTIH